MVVKNFVRIRIPGTPISQGRPRAYSLNGKARVYSPQKNRTYKEVVQIFAMQSMRNRKATAMPLHVTISFFLEIPKSWTKEKRLAATVGKILPTSRPDIDNYIKAIFDSLNGIAFADDSQIVSMHAVKLYTPNKAYVDVEIKEIVN